MNATPHASVRRSPRFRLTRYFVTTSLVGILVVTVSLLSVYRELTVRQLIEHESRANADLSQVFANAVWEKHRPFLVGSRGRTREALLADPMLAALRTEVLASMQGLKVAKVKIYNLDGLTVFSTDKSQIGEDKSANQGFRDARDGRIVGDITYRDRFDAFDGVIADRNLIFTYIPVHTHDAAGRDGATQGVFEVYSDVTDLMAQQRRAQWQVAGIVLGAFATLYLFLYFVVRKADRIIARQERERAEKEAQIQHQAYHDALTGLPNRTYFAERVGESLALSLRYGRSGVVMFIDLDRFKIVNDSLGHQAGDQLLKLVATRIRDCLRKSDLLFRMGGDEFMVVMPEIAAPENAAHMAQRIIAAVAAPVSLYEHQLTVGATIGIAVFPGDGDTPEALVKNADAAMYSAKQAGRGTHAFYRAAMNRQALERLELEEALRKAFRNGELTLYYQPRLDAATRRVVAVEALLRWVSPARGVVAPGEFIGVLEEMGMMPIVGEWVLRSACAQVRLWRDEGVPPLRVSVNVSARQFQSPGFAAVVARVLSDTGVEPARIELELTESLLVTHPEEARAMVASLKALGVRIAIDDFGAGYSSLNYLRHFEVDYLKIDRGFVVDIATNERDRAVATAIAQIAAALGMTVVAEGVESEAQAAFCSSLGFGELQGYLFSRPLPPEELKRYLAASSAQATQDKSRIAA